MLLYSITNGSFQSQTDSAAEVNVNFIESIPSSLTSLKMSKVKFNLADVQQIYEVEDLLKLTI